MQLDLKGNTSQNTTTGKNLIPNILNNQTINGVTFVVNPDKSVTINGTASATTQINLLTNTIGEADEVTLPAGTYTLQGCPTGGAAATYKLDITNNGSAVITDYGNDVYSRIFTDSWTFDRVRIVVQSGTTVNNLTFKPMLVEGNTNVPYEPYTGGQSSPNPDYPQDIHVVTGNNSVGVQGKNLWGGKTFTTSQYSVDFTINVDGTVTANGTATNNSVSGTITQYNNNQMYKTLSAGTYTVSKNSDKIQLQVYDTSSNLIKSLLTTQNNGSFTLENSTDIIVRIMVPSGTSIDETFTLQLEQGSTATSYEPYQHEEYPVNLGNLELCKIGDYQDYLYKENGNWYKYEKILKAGANSSWYLGSSTPYEGIYQIQFNNTNALFIQDSNARVLSNMYKGIAWGSSWKIDNAITVGRNIVRIMTSNYTSINDFKEFLSNNNFAAYYVINVVTPIQITDETLIAQLDAIEKAKSNEGQTNIAQTNADLPFIINATALLKNN